VERFAPANWSDSHQQYPTGGERWGESPQPGGAIRSTSSEAFASPCHKKYLSHTEKRAFPEDFSEATTALAREVQLVSCSDRL
jgi:hypothetical protein